MGRGLHNARGASEVLFLQKGGEEKAFAKLNRGEGRQHSVGWEIVV